MALTVDQRRNLAMNVLSKVNELFEFWEENADSTPWPLDDVNVDEAMQVVANWLAPLPTNGKWLGPMPVPTVKAG